LDSDTIVEPDAIANLVQPFADQRVYCACGHGEVLNKNENILTEFQRVWYADAFRVQKAFESNFGMVTCCSGLLAAYRREKLIAVLGDLLNEKFLGREVRDSEDRTITNLLLKANGRSVYQANAVAHTVVPNTAKKFIMQQLRWGRGSFRGLLFAMRFFWRRGFIQSILFYSFVTTIYLTPIVVLVNLVVFPILGYPILSLIYLAGILLVHFLMGLNDTQLVKNFRVKDIIHRTLFGFIAIALSMIYLYAWITSWKCGKWMTR
jgi:hyaluronan synthase